MLEVGGSNIYGFVVCSHGTAKLRILEIKFFRLSFESTSSVVFRFILGLLIFDFIDQFLPKQLVIR